jgi:hypothetical protein
MSAQVPAAVLADLRLGVAAPDSLGQQDQPKLVAGEPRQRILRLQQPAKPAGERHGRREVSAPGPTSAKCNSGQAGQADNLKDAEQLAAMSALLDAIPKPTLARSTGTATAALGRRRLRHRGGHNAAKFAFTEAARDHPCGHFPVRPR